MKVLITRAEPAASQTAKNLAKHGHEAILMPLFEVVDTGIAIPDEEYDGVIFTSKNAVDILQKRGWQTNFETTPAFCVGEKTEFAAKALGFKTTYKANGGGGALVKLMSNLEITNRRFLYPSTPDKSFDMQKALKTYNAKLKTIDIYQAKPKTLSLKDIKQTISEPSIKCVFVYSALSYQHLANIIKAAKLESFSKQCTLVAISSQAINLLDYIQWKDVLIADKPKEDAMISLIP